MNVDSTLARQQGCRQQDPEMPSPPAHFECRFDVVLPEVVLELQQVFHGFLVISINGHPFAALSQGIDCVQTDCDLSLQMTTDRFFGQLKSCPGILLCGPEVIMTPILWVWAHG